MMQKRYVILGILLLLTSMVVPFSAIGQTNQMDPVNLMGDQSVDINCEGSRLVVQRQSRTQIMAQCRPSPATPTPEPPSSNLEVVQLILINADTDQDVGPLEDGATIDFAALSTENLSIRAVTNPSTVGSVIFGLDDNSNLQTENLVPYAIAGDDNGNYNPWSPSLGSHVLTVTPYSSSNGGGEAGTPLVVNFTVVDGGGGSEPPTPTDTPVPGPTNTPVPPPAPDQAYEIGIDLNMLSQVRDEINQGEYDRPCTEEEHDPTKWHLLVSPEHKCHYDHHHGDDPNYVNDIFGPPGEWFGQSGQSVSYPWQTFAAKTALEPNDEYVANNQMENDLKHAGYGWIVRRNQPCPDGYCITDFRLQYHGIFGAHGAVTRYHSYSFEARVCKDANDPSSCGIVRNGGWADYGRLFTTDGVLDCGQAVQENFITLPADTLYFPIDRPEARDEIRCHPILASAPAYPSNRPIVEWWAHSPNDRIRFQLRSYDPLGNINPSNPTQWHLYCDTNDVNCRYDQSITTVWIGYVLKVPEFIGGVRLDSNRDGRTDYLGFGNRWGERASDCTEPGLDCVPTEYSNVVLNQFADENGVPKEGAYSHTICADCPKTDYDLTPAGQQWITWFHKYVQ